MNLVLTSNFPSTPIKAVYRLMRSVGERPRVAWIPPFKEIDNTRFTRAKMLFKVHGLERLERYGIGGRGTDSSTRLEDYDIIFISGGDPIKFRTNLLQSDLATHLRKSIDTGKMIVASSGGSMQLAQNISVFRLINLDVEQVIAQRNEYEALGIVPYEFLPHLNAHGKSFLEKVRRYSQATSHPVIGVEDGGALIHESRGKYQLIGQASIFHRGDIEFIEAQE
jgi:dipeptidase E